MAALKPVYWDEATSALAKRDRVLKKLIRAHPGVHLRTRGDPFTSLSRAIVGQQISVKAADTIWRRFVATVAPHPQAKIVRKLDPRAVAALELVAVKGIGRWTAEMFLIFHELRADVLPVDDIGLQRAIAVHYNRGQRMTPAAMRDLAQQWQPYRSVATWYLWRSLDPIPVEY